MRRCRALLIPTLTRGSERAAPRQTRRPVRHIPSAIARTAGVVGAVRRQAVWDLRCRRPIPLQWRKLRLVTAPSRRAPLTANRARRPALLVAQQVISGCRCAAGVGFPARRGYNEERRMRRRQAAIRPRATLPTVRRARKASFRAAGGVDAHSRASAKLCRPAKTNQPTARGGMPLGRRVVGDPTVVPAREERTTFKPSDLGSRSIAGEVVDRVTGTAAAPAVPNPLAATTGARAGEVRAAREMGSADGDAMPRQGAS